MPTKKKRKVVPLTAPAKKTALDIVLRERAEKRFWSELDRLKIMLSSSLITQNMRLEITKADGSKPTVYYHQMIETHPAFEEIKERILNRYEAEETKKLMDELTNWKQQKL